MMFGGTAFATAPTETQLTAQTCYTNTESILSQEDWYFAMIDEPPASPMPLHHVGTQ